MATELALPLLFEAVTARFKLDGTAARNAFGWRMPTDKTITGDRILWIPGDDSRALGSVSAAKQPGRNPRPLVTLDELFTVEVIGQDPKQPENELLQYTRTRELYDAWYRAVYLAARGTFTVLSSRWLVNLSERRHGAAIRVVVRIDSMIPDAALQTAPVDAYAVVAVSELDQTETDEIHPTDTEEP